MKPLLAGTMGEAHHLSHQERVDLIKTARQVLDDAGFKEVPIISGSGAGSTRETIELSKEAAAAGADYVIVICSGYFAGALANNKNALKAFWSEVSEKSPIPVIIYNCEWERFLSGGTGLNGHGRPRSCWWDRSGLGHHHGVGGGEPQPGWREADVRSIHRVA